jgi:ATP-binding cassette subfamily B protein
MNIILVLKYYWPHVKKYKKSTFLVFFCYGLAVASTTVVTPLIYRKIIDLVMVNPDPLLIASQLITIVLFLGGIIILNNIFYRAGDYSIFYVQSQVLKDVADDAFQRLQKHSYDYFTGVFIGSLVARVKRYISSFENIFDYVIFSVWWAGLKLSLIFVVLVWIAPLLAGIFFVWLALYIGLTSLFIKKKMKKDLLTAEANSYTTGILADVLTNVFNVKIFGSQKREEVLFKDATLKEEQLRRRSWYFGGYQYAFQGFFIGVFEFVGMYAAVYLWIKGHISAGTIVLMQVYIYASFDSVWNISKNFTRAMYALAEAKEMVDVFEMQPSVVDPLNPLPCTIKEGHIKISNISFSYGKGKLVFKNFSLEIAPGEKVGIVGHSGAGKSTLTKLLLRFVDVDKGTIAIDGQDITQITQDDLRAHISYVPQDALLFHRTLRDNIAYAREGASDEEIINSAKQAHADDFIQKLSKKYDTLVGERGIKLSGGERQRVAIARAMLKHSPILILDEATSSLDSISEKYIQDSFVELMKGRTTLVIAHRLSTLQKMDRIIVLDGGEIAESGAHNELLKNKGIYYNLWKHQNQGFME